MTHSFTSYNTASHEFAIFIYSSLARSQTFVFCIMRINIFDWTKNPLTEKSVSFWLLSTIIDSLWLCYFAVTPLKDILSVSNGKSNSVKISYISSIVIFTHLRPPLLLHRLLYLLHSIQKSLPFLRRLDLRQMIRS